GNIFHRTLAVDASQKQRRQQPAGPLLHAGARLPTHTFQINVRESFERLQESIRSLAIPQTLQQEMIQTEGQIECRVAEPGAFGIQEHWTTRPRENVLRADVAVNQGNLGLQR